MAEKTSARDGAPDAGRTVGAGVAGGCLAGALVALGESSWIASHAGTPTGTALMGYALVLYGTAGALAGTLLGLVTAAIRRVLGRAQGTIGGIYTSIAGITLVFMAFPVAKLLVGRDLFVGRIYWMGPRGLLVQAALLAALCALFFLLTLGLGRLLDRLPPIVSGPLVTPPAVLVAGVVLLLLPGPAPGAPPGGSASPEGPHVVLVMVDTLRADVCDPWGDMGLTPRLGDLARRGVVFENARAHSSWTRPSVATVFSGRYPSSHGAMFKSDLLSDEVSTIAESLQEAGWDTHGVVSNYVTAPYFNFGQGFDEYVYLEPSYPLLGGEFSSKLTLYDTLRRLHAKALPGSVRPGSRYRDGSVVTAEALRWVEDWYAGEGSDGRFFLFVQYMDPHDPYYAHPHDGDAPSRQTVPYPTPGMRDRFWDLYTGEVTYWDTQFGLLLEGLEKTPGWEDTLVVVFSDHGEEFLEHGGWWHGDTLYEEAIRVPLVVRLPGDEEAGRRIPDDVGLVDVAPTITRLAGLPVHGSWQGRSLFAEHGGPHFAEEQHVGNDLHALVYTGPAGHVWKVITGDIENPRGLPARSLFDLSVDPHETENLAPARSSELSLALELLAKAIAGASRGAVSEKPVELDEASRRRLEELGYIQ